MENYCSNITVKKRARQIALFCVMGFFLSLYSCNAIFEKDISADTVDLIIPTNGDTLSTNQLHVKWNELKERIFTICKSLLLLSNQSVLFSLTLI